MKKVLSLLLVIVMIITIVPVSAIMASAENYTGKCGDTSETGNTVSYNFDKDTGLLNIVGKGKMRNDCWYSLGLSDCLSNTSSVQKVIIGANVTRIGNKCFYSDYTNTNYQSTYRSIHSKLAEVIVGENVKEIGSQAFLSAHTLNIINIPSSCLTIGSFAFYDCYSLNELIIGNGIQTLGESAFSDCKALPMPSFPTSLRSVGKQCFQNCSSMTGDMVLYSNLATIGENAFYGTNLDSITIYNSDCEIFENATTIPMKTKIIGHIGSTAQAYADEFGNEFEAIEGETTEVVEPTCTEQGYTIHTCNDCGGTFKDTYTGALGHKEIPAPAQAATCTEAGHEKGFVCSVCGAVINGFEEIPATGHSEEVTKQAVAPTCTNTGLTEEITCSVCKEVLQEQTEIPVLGHRYEEETITEPTCTEKGLKRLTCSVCHESHTEEIPALNHNYVNHVVAPTCTKKGYTRAICERCNNEFDFDFVEATGEHSYQGVVTTPATCIEKGIKTFTCSACGDSYTEDIECIAHSVVTDNAVAATCTKTGLTAGSHCSRCGTVIIERTETKATGHNYISAVTAPTCKDKGYTTYTCSKCGDSYKADYVNATENHVNKTVVTKQATCTQKGIKVTTCSVCGKSTTATIEMTSHETVVDKAVVSTCNRAGLTAGSHCAVCGYVIEEQAVVPASGHSYNAVVTEPTCKEQGYTTHTCTVCGDNYKDSYTNTTNEHDYKATITTPSTCSKEGVRTYTCSICGDKYTRSIETIDHTPKADSAAAPTCTKAGLTAGSHCEVCGYVIEEQKVIPAIGHSYNAVVTESTCKDKGYTTHTCVVCGDSYKDSFTDVIANHDYKAVITTPATCTKQGVKTFTCSVCGDKYTEAIAMTEHTPTADKAVAPTCTKAGLTLGSHCSVCGFILEEQKTVPAAGHTYRAVVTEPTCKDRGCTTHICTVCGDSYKDTITQTTQEHDYKATITTPATCSKEGVKTFTCSVCGDKYTEAIAMKEHTPVVDKTVAPTCSKAGLTAGSHCSVCGYVIKEQEVVSAKSHTYTSTITKDSSCSQAGVKTFTCSICGDKYTEAIPMKAHTVVSDNAVEPTCTKYGLSAGEYCSVCGKIFETQEKIEPLGHDFGAVVTPATLMANGVITHPCSRCDNTEASEVIYAPKTFTLAKTSYVYTGKAIAPAVAVKDSKGKALVKGTDYTVAYKNNKNIGTASVVITFKGNYEGTKTLAFTILPKATNLALAGAKKAFTAKWTKVAGVTGYQIQYATNAKFTIAKAVTVKGAAKYAQAVKNLKGGAKYYVRIRTYKTVDGKNYFSTWSAAKAVTTKK